MSTHHVRLPPLPGEPPVRRVAVKMGAKEKRFCEVEHIYNVKEGRKGNKPFNVMLGLNVD